MKQLTKRIFAVALSLAMMIALVPSAFASSTINIKIDGDTVPSDTAPVLRDDRTLVPVRVITEYLGADVTWDNAKNEATIKTAAYEVVFTIGSKVYTVNGAPKTMDVAPELINDRTMIPLRAIAESIGAEVSYDAATDTAIVNYFTKMSGSIKISGSTTVQPISQAAADKLIAMNSGLSVTVAGGGSGTGIKEAISGANDIGESSRDLTADEASTLSVFVVANDGIAIIVNPANPVKNLTKEQAEKIFLGEITNWKDVGGNNAPILVQTRETGSGTLATLSEMLLEKKDVVSTATPYSSTELLKQAVASSANSIGFISLGYIDSTVKAVSVNSITPTETTIKNGAYALSRNLYVFTKGVPSGINARFIDYLKSVKCQSEIVEEEGYISIR